jgi:uncharacterized membrane protein
MTTRWLARPLSLLLAVVMALMLVVAADVAAPTPADAATPAQSAVAYARAQLGDRYCWGGTGPSCFDCSGLTWRAYRQAGISIPRVSRDQYRATTRLSRSQLAPGDLVFMGRSGYVTHVGIYEGSGNIIEASSSRGRVTRFTVSQRASIIVGYGRVRGSGAVSSSSSCFTHNTLLRYGSRGAAVSEWQRVANRLGANLAVDGVFGPRTLKATKAIQSKLGVRADGVVGPITRAAACRRL